jgi:hypothetical protein
MEDGGICVITQEELSCKLLFTAIEKSDEVPEPPQRDPRPDLKPERVWALGP